VKELFPKTPEAKLMGGNGGKVKIGEGTYTTWGGESPQNRRTKTLEDEEGNNKSQTINNGKQKDKSSAKSEAPNKRQKGEEMCKETRLKVAPEGIIMIYQRSGQRHLLE
jgi:hypothetical protein